MRQNAADLSDLLSSGRDRKAEEVAFAEELESRSLIFKAERCFYLARSYSLTGKRPEAYALYGRTRSLAEKALQRCRSWTNCDPSVIKELESLHGECRYNSCIEHAAGIVEEHKGSDNLSQKVSALSLSGADKKVEKLLMEKLDVYESAVGNVGNASTKGAPRIVAFPPAFVAVPRNPIVLDLVYNLLEFPSLENRMRKDNKGFISRLWR